MAVNIDVGDDVQWKWGGGTGEGTVVERFTQRVTRTISGTDVTRNATDDEPAFLIEQADGDQVLKSITELSPARDDHDRAEPTSTGHRWTGHR